MVLLCFNCGVVVALAFSTMSIFRCCARQCLERSKISVTEAAGCANFRDVSFIPSRYMGAGLEVPLVPAGLGDGERNDVSYSRAVVFDVGPVSPK